MSKNRNHQRTDFVMGSHLYAPSTEPAIRNATNDGTAVLFYMASDEDMVLYNGEEWDLIRKVDFERLYKTPWPPAAREGQWGRFTHLTTAQGVVLYHKVTPAQLTAALTELRTWVDPQKELRRHGRHKAVIDTFTQPEQEDLEAEFELDSEITIHARETQARFNNA